MHDAAAVALLFSPHPGALSLLIAHRHDSYNLVRERAVEALGQIGKTDPQMAIPILQEMTKDKDKMVSGEAKRYLKLLTKNN